jgi:hypothetical protein
MLPSVIASNTATKRLAIFDNILLMALWMTFRGSACPALDELDPLLSLSDSVSFHPAKNLAVFIPTNDKGKVDIYIDDTIGITPDLQDNTHRVSRVIPLAIHTLTRPLDSSDMIPRKDIISMKTFKAEGRMEEQKRPLVSSDMIPRKDIISMKAFKAGGWMEEQKPF